MGTWSTSLFGNDTTTDVRDTYTHLLRNQSTDDEAYIKTCEEYAELMGSDEEPLFWYALADAQWSAGRLLPEVKEKALYFMHNCKDFPFGEEKSPTKSEKWKNTLQKLEQKITTPMPPKKKFRKPIEFERNPWNVGDIYAYQFHTPEAKEKGFYGKYIALQKAGNIEYYEGVVLSVIHVFDHVFDYIPTLEALLKKRLLPLVKSPYDGPDRFVSASQYTQPFAHFLRAYMFLYKKNDYPKQYLTHIGTIAVPECLPTLRYYDLAWSIDEMDKWLIEYYLTWHGVKY